jgi:hypothetical protein
MRGQVASLRPADDTLYSEVPASAGYGDKCHAQ